MLLGDVILHKLFNTHSIIVNLTIHIFQYAQRGVGVAILISTDGIKVISPDGQVIIFVCFLACTLFVLFSLIYTM